MTGHDLHEAARLVRLWAPVVHAVITEDWDEVRRLSDGVDPIDCMAFAACLEVEAMLRGADRRAVRA
jgi:hypothetical protein